LPDRREHSNGVFGSEPPLSLASLDAAISETCERPIRRDRLARDDRVYRWICRRIQREGCFAFKTTYAEAASGAGYEVPRLNCRENRRQARHMRVSTVYRALSSLAAAGLIRFRGVKRANGQWRCLRIELLPAGRGTPPAGRSRRGATRRPGGKISLSRRSGTSPAVPGLCPGNNPPAGAFARARERDGPDKARRDRSAIRQIIRRELSEAGDALEADLVRDHRGKPAEERRFERRYGRHLATAHEAVELCDAFEAAFGRDSHFSLRKAEHAGRLQRILARFDRYTGVAGRRQLADRAGVGLAEARRFVEAVGREARAGVGWAAKIDSLAYFLPVLDELSKGRRRHWKATQAEPWERTYPWAGLRGKAA
jgi:hypothetical protein